VTLTDVGGVYTDNPKENPDAELIEEVRGREIEEVWSHVGEDAADFGGITTKVEGAERVNHEGIPAIIAASEEEHVLRKVRDGDSVGTFFGPEKGGKDDRD
jgi:glutamate 5-kinase